MREAYNLFNEISDQLYGPENCKDNSGENQKTEDVTGEEEAEDAAASRARRDVTVTCEAAIRFTYGKGCVIHLSRADI